MCYASGRIAIVRQLPELFYTDAINLRLAAFIQAKTLNQLFSQRTARSFAQHSYLRKQIDAGFKIGLALPFLIDAFVSGANTDDLLIFVVKNFSARKLRKDVNACLFAFFTKPRREPVKRHYVVPMIPERRRSDWRTNGAILCQVEEIVFIDGGFKRRTLFHKIRKQFLQSTRIHHGAGKNMGAN